MLARLPLVVLFWAALVAASVAFSLPSASLTHGVVLASTAALLGLGAAVWVRSRLTRSIALLVLVMALAGGGALLQRTTLSKRQVLLPPESSTVIVDGVIEDVTSADEGVLLRLAVDAIGPELGDGGTPQAIGVAVDVALTAPVKVDAGDRVRLRGRLRAPAPSLSPGTFDPYKAALVHGVHARMTVVQADDVAVFAKGRGAWWVRARRSLSARLQAQLPPRLAGLLLALLIGDTSLFSIEQSAAYRSVGAGHLLAVSGLQVTLLAGLLSRVMTSLLLFTPWGRRGRGALVAALFALAGVWGFVLLCGAPPSAVRAGVMATAVVFASAGGRRVLLVDALGAAGLLTVVASPASALDAGFLLSYAAVFGLVVASAGDHDGATLIDQIRAGVAASVIAGLLTLPLSAWLFAQVAPAGLLANIVLVPVASLLQVPALLGGALGAVLDLPWLSALGAQAALLLEALVFGLAELLPGVRAVDATSGVQAALLSVAVGVAGAAWLSRRVVAAVVVVLSSGFIFALSNREPDGLRVTFLPVGQGDAAVVELPQGQVFVIDGGGRVPVAPGMSEAARASVLAEPGARVVVPFLQRRGIQRIDVVVLSHPHPDHAGGLRAVVDAFPVGEVWWAGDVDTAGPLVQPLFDRVGASSVRSTPELLGQHRHGDVIIDVLGPAPAEATATYPEFSANDNSLVLRFCLGATCVLLPGDVEHFGEEELVATHENRLHAQVVKAPHHGSSTSSTTNFITATKALHVVMCTGRGNQFGFPAASVVQRWRAASARVWDTSRHGELTFLLDGTGVTAQPFRHDEDDDNEDDDEDNNENGPPKNHATRDATP